MPNYLVLNTDAVPALGTEKQCRVFRTTAATEQAANDAAAAFYGVDNGAHLWVGLETGFTRYTNTKTITYSSVAG